MRQKGDSAWHDDAAFQNCEFSDMFAFLARGASTTEIKNREITRCPDASLEEGRSSLIALLQQRMNCQNLRESGYMS